ncbi:helix-turn-helix domain-containing protein [Mesorhizobium sp. YR577]|uniref:IclR family transcriptional regulator n=1 Tax=Mesorhizobium sp. YR577 TaxID=1884373 RepID=UPI0008E7623B|nr:helix-turn-helix domain-containing protein [Mesorhizobium sp. YR577]SFU21802.1 DNA-binding transcriptional regulator, IclR family [Mesorhizobium sp. YR577]
MAIANRGQEITDKTTTTLQTLDRGLVTLGHVARSREGVTVAEIARFLGVHRAIAYRIVATLETHGMVVRSKEGRVFLGIGIPAIANQFMPQFKVLAEPLLRDLAADTDATAFVALADGVDCVAILVEEPSGQLIRVGYRVGSRHPLERGAAGIAILAGRAPRPDDPETVRQARAEGYSLTRGQLQKGAIGVAVRLRSADANPGTQEFSIGVVAMEDLDTARAIASLQAAARTLDGLLGATGDTEA